MQHQMDSCASVLVCDNIQQVSHCFVDTVFAVTEDRIRPTPNRASPARQWIVRSQARGEPDCEISCDVGQATLDSLQLNVRMNTTGRVFFVLQANSSALEPDIPSVRPQISMNWPEDALADWNHFLVAQCKPNSRPYHACRYTMVR